MNIHLLVFQMPKNSESASAVSLQLLEEAAKNQGHKLVIIEAKKCKLKFEKKPQLLIENKKPNNIKVLITKASFGGKGVYAHANLIKQFELTGIRVINKNDAVIKAKNKLTTLQVLNENGIVIPKTYVVRSAEYIPEVMKDIGSYPVILKAASGQAGVGVSIIESQRGLRSIVEMLMEDEEADPIIIQKYIKEAKGKDLRVFVVGKKIVGAMERIATRRGEFRSNFSLGGRVKIASLSKIEQKMALAATKACGLDFSGVDIIRTKTGPKVLEVNANPGLKGITQATGKDIAGELIRYAARRAKK